MFPIWVGGIEKIPFNEITLPSEVDTHNLLKTKLAGEGIPVWGVTLWYDWLYTFKSNELELVIQ